MISLIISFLFDGAGYIVLESLLYVLFPDQKIENTKYLDGDVHMLVSNVAKDSWFYRYLHLKWNFNKNLV